MVRGNGYACGGSANVLIERWFGDCVYTSWDALAFFIGLSSVFFWIVAQLPQLISNFMRKSAEALSPWFLAQWLAGDSFNFLGCVLTGDQLATQTITAGYFMFSDLIIISQYAYYQILYRKEAYYSDSDESLHKGSGYSDLQKPESSTSTTLESLMEQNALTSMVKDDKIEADHVKNSSSTAFLNSQEATSDGKSIPCIDLQERSDNWMYQHRHHLRRIVQEYGLEYGHRMVSHLNALYRKHRKERVNNDSKGNAATGRRRQTKALVGVACLFALATTVKLPKISVVNTTPQLGYAFNRRILLALPEQRLSIDMSTLPWASILGRVFGWGSSALYLGSRLSQLVKNRERKSTDGLSLGMVTCAILANGTYGAAIMMRTFSWTSLIGKAPWLIGSLGTVLLDLTIFFQAQYYTRHMKKAVLDEYTPLLA